MRVAEAKLPELAPPSEETFANGLLLMDTLPRRQDSAVMGELRFAAYQMAIGHYPQAAFEWMVSQAVRTCKFFPSTSECVEILSRWKRDDKAARHRHIARVAVREELQARLEETLADLAAGKLDQAAIDALPESVKEIAETRAILRRTDNQTYYLSAGIRRENEGAMQ